LRTVIVGDGPAACSTAISLLSLQKNADVLILGKNFSRTPVRCGGGVGKYMLEKIGLKIPKEVIGSYIKRVRLYSPDNTSWELDCSDMKLEDMGYVLYRDKFDRWLIKEASKKGAQIYEKTVTTSLLRNISYDVLVGADGVTSTVAKFAGRSELKLKDVHHCVQLTTYWKEYPKDLITLYFGNKIAPQGYAWIFPCGEHVRIGLGIPLSLKQNPTTYLRKFLKKIEAPENGEFIAKLIPTAKPPKTGVYNNILLVGDALPSTDPLTGGGICQAIGSGIAAGRAIAKGQLKKYDKYIRWLHKQNTFRYYLKKILFSFSDKNFNELVKTMQQFKPETPSLSKELRKAIIHYFSRNTSNFFKGMSYY